MVQSQKSERSFLWELREAAKHCTNAEYKSALTLAADELSGWIEILHNNATKANMQDLNGAWARAEKMLEACPPMGDPGDLGGDAEPAKLAA